MSLWCQLGLFAHNPLQRSILPLELEMKKVSSLLRFRVVRPFCNASQMRVERIRGISLLFLCASGTSLWGQALPTATSARLNLDPGVFVSAVAINTQFPLYADNALGFNFGAFLQSSHLIGAEVRGGYYPVSARFTQAPITAGIRIISRRSSGTRWLPFGYIGGGVSRVQNEGPTYQPTAASWSPCWQASAGLDVSFARFSWRAAEASWTETYSVRDDLRSLSVSTGLVYRFNLGHPGEREAAEKAALAIAQMPYRIATDRKPVDSSVNLQ
jgi:hypothetical protein